MPNHNINRRVVLSGSQLDPDTIAYISLFSPKPSQFFTLAVNKLVISLKASGNWSKLDRFWIFAVENEANAVYSLVNPSSTPAVKVGSPTFVASVGYTGVSNTGYLRSNFIPSSSGVNYVLNSACHGMYSRTNSQSAGFDMGASDASNDSWLSSRIAGNVTAHRNNQASADLSGATTSSLGLNTASRSASNLSTAYLNGVALAPTSATLSSALPTREFYLLTRNGNGTPVTSSQRQQSLAFIGGGNIDQLSFYNSIQEFAVKIGFNV